MPCMEPLSQRLAQWLHLATHQVLSVLAFQPDLLEVSVAGKECAWCQEVKQPDHLIEPNVLPVNQY